MDIKKEKLEIQNLEQKKLFVTGIGTEIGKTVCSAILVKYFKADYWKPIQSGDLHFSDSMKIKKWVGENVIIHPEKYRLQLAASPHQSAAEEDILINTNDFKLPETQNNLIVEGAGGLMVPISEDEFIIDLIEKLKLPVALVVRNYLGCINHTLLSLMILKQRNIKLEYLILNGSFPWDTERIICKNIQQEIKIIRIPEVEKITIENIESITKQLEKNMIDKTKLRNDWTKEEIEEIYNLPLLELIYKAATVHREWHNPEEVQMSTLLSIKTGGCVEDCSYCGQAARYHTNIKVQALLPTEKVIEHAQKAKDNGSSRFCMAAAWREVRNNRDFDRVIDMVKGVNELGLEVCCTLGMLTEEQAVRLEQAGLYAYNHNLDTSEQYYEEIISTRTFDNRINTINNVRKAGITVCSGGIIGLGETHADRISMLLTLATMPRHPESVPINALARVAGTPLENNEKTDTWEMVRMIAIARIVMPSSMVRLSAGRIEMTEFEQGWCFMAGANSIFTGERETLLVTPNPGVSEDMQMLQTLGLKPMKRQSEKVMDQFETWKTNF